MTLRLRYAPVLSCNSINPAARHVYRTLRRRLRGKKSGEPDSAMAAVFGRAIRRCAVVRARPPGCGKSADYTRLRGLSSPRPLLHAVYAQLGSGNRLVTACLPGMRVVHLGKGGSGAQDVSTNCSGGALALDSRPGGASTRPAALRRCTKGRLGVVELSADGAGSRDRALLWRFVVLPSGRTRDDLCR